MVSVKNLFLWVCRNELLQDTVGVTHISDKSGLTTSYGVHDTLRYGYTGVCRTSLVTAALSFSYRHSSARDEISPAHPLEQVLANVSSTYILAS